MIKRTAALLLSVCICILMAAPFASADDVEKSNEAYNVLKEMGLITKEADETFTRAEFAQFMYNIKIFSEEKKEDLSWEENFFGNISEDFELAEDEGKVYKFDDVDPYDEYTQAIMRLVDTGIMEGVGSESFAPDRAVKNTEVIKTVLECMGYSALCNIRGGYPAGYMSVASELGISDGVDISESSEAAVSDAARVIYNAFDVKLMKLSFGENGKEISQSSSDTFLTGIMHVDYIKGVMTDNGITSLYGESEAGKGFIICNGITLNNNGENAVKVREYIGCNVKVFYFNSGDSENDIVHILPLNKNEIVTINADDINYFKDGRLNYNEGKRSKTVSLPRNIKMIYNGMAEKSFNEDTFLFENGTVTLIAPNGGEYETVIINRYTSLYIGFVDNEEKIIYNKAYSKDGTIPKSLSFKESLEEETLGIFDREGRTLDFTELSAGMVIDVCGSGTVMNIIAGDGKISDVKVKSMGEDEYGTRYIEDSEQRYYFDSIYEKAAEAPLFSLNETIDVYLNSFGKVIWAEKKDGYNLKVGYLLKVVTDEDDLETVWFKILNTEGGVSRYKNAGKVKFGDTQTADSADYVKLKPGALYAGLKPYEGSLIGYGLDGDGLIETIELPLESRGGENRLQLIYNSNGEKVTYKADGFGYFKDYTWIDETTRIFNIPADGITDETKYSCGDRTGVFTSQQDYDFKSYGTNQNGNFAEYMVTQNDVVTSMDFHQSFHSFFIVSEVKRALSPDDEPAVKISGYKTNGYRSSSFTEMTLYAKDGAGQDRQGNKVNPALMVTDTLSMNVENNKNPQYYEIKAGDIIRYTYDAEEIYPNNIELLYRADMENPYFGEKGGQKGGIAGSVGIIDSSLTDSYRYNPFTFKDSKGTLGADVSDMYSGYRVMYGFVYSVDNGISTVTTQDLTVESYDPNLGGGKYFRSYVPMRGSATKIAVSFNKKNVSVKTASIDDIKPYSDYYSECSKILSITDGGYFTAIFVINGEFGK